MIAVAEIEPLILLRFIRFTLNAFDDSMMAGSAYKDMWTKKRELFLSGNEDVFFHFLSHFNKFFRRAFAISIGLAPVTMMRELVFADDPAEAEAVTVGLMSNLDIKCFEREIKRIVDYSSGRRLKSIPPEGSPLAQKVYILLGDLLARDEESKVIQPPRFRKFKSGVTLAGAIVKTLNDDPEWKQVPRRVLKGGSKKRSWSVAMLYGKLGRDKNKKNSFADLKKAVLAHYST